MRVTLLPQRIGRDDNGAVAVLVAILAVVLFGSAAVAVDLGKAYQRRRATQTTADLAALAGAQDLPNAQTACRSAVRYLLHNPPSGEAFDVTEADCSITGDTPDGTVDVTPGNTSITVSVPRREVQFGFAAVLGYSGTSVDAQATAEIQSPAPSLPFFLPADVPSGLLCLKDTTRGGASPSAMRAVLLAAKPTAPPGGGSGGPPATSTAITSVEPQPFEGLPGTVVTLHGTQLDVIVRLTFGGVAATDISVATNGKKLTATVPASTDTGTVPVVGWTNVNQTGPSYATPEPFTYLVPDPPVDDCAGSTGQFGHLDIPRGDGTPVGKEVEYNIIKSIDHAIATFPTADLPAPGTPCANAAGNFPITSSTKPDIDPGVDGANCLLTQTGNSLPNATRGFLDGIDGLAGRLADHAPTGTVATRGGINIDTFATYLRGGATLADFSGPGAAATIDALPAGSLDRSILASPRFAVVPVLNVLSDGTNNGFYPVLTLHGVFVDSAPSAPQHGFVTSNGDSQVTAIHVYSFPMHLLPAFLSTSEVDGTVTYIGSGPKVPVLVK
ncbi:MAG TPA: pilus assembly protein TadG-related protein [Mycobacteriales bacterium]|nr:pilus assembly protein TadG-related protein [Mycobacteriales bacterium]